jgi:flavin-dependent dehydrogenase
MTDIPLADTLAKQKTMTDLAQKYDLAVVGGGLAGLTLAIQVNRMGHSVVLFEKEKYPFHRVCGEYISRESVPFLLDMGIDTGKMRLPMIDKLMVSSPDGNLLKHRLPLGGFGISRYLLDYTLAEIAIREGVHVLENDKVQDIIYEDGVLNVQSASGNYRCKAAAGSFGKRSNIDVKWGRPFIRKKPSKLNNYIGVKYHIKTDFPPDTIALHNFQDGYCGMSKIEGDKYCLCYLTTAANLKEHHHSIKEMENGILRKNPFLDEVFKSSAFLFDEPVVISQVSFEKKSTVENHVLMIGDAAGMITPLCGNGMSMAMHAGKIAAGLLKDFLEGKISRDEMENRYITKWNNTFSSRLRTGRMIQSMFGKPVVTNLFIRSMKPFPALVTKLIQQTHGETF